jgi:hypothetical protein
MTDILRNTVLPRLVVAGLAGSLLLAGCGGSPDLAACKQAMQKQLAAGIAHPGGPAGTKPKECGGVSDADLERLGKEALSEQLGGTPTTP